MIYYDLTSSMTYIGRNPVGIVRVEMKLAEYILKHMSPEEITFCYFDLTYHRVSYLRFSDAQGVLEQIGSTMCATTMESSQNDQVPPQQNGLSRREMFWVYVRKAKEAIKQLLVWQNPHPSEPALKKCSSESLLEPLDVPWNENDIFVTVGLIWDIWPVNRLYLSRKLKHFKVVGSIQDMIPYFAPEFCRGVPPSFFQAVVDLIWSSSLIIAPSLRSLEDIQCFARESHIPCSRICVNVHGSDVIHLSEDYIPPREEIDVSKLVPGHFIFQVGTMEPRKNHQVIYNAYRILVNEGFQPMTWVFVGAQAWGCADLLESIKLNPALYPKYIMMSNRVSDQTLAWLYKNCAFTVYPSFYEGWGLPVSESLAFGKFCLTGTNSALVEAGSGMTEQINPFDALTWAKILQYYMQDPEHLKQKEERIQAQYKIRSWTQSSEEFFAHIKKLQREGK